MARYIIIFFLALFLVGCANQPVKLRTEVQEVFKPILYCPAPDWTGLEKPVLAIDGINSTTPPGEVAKRYKATVKQLESFADRLEHALRRYDATNEAYKTLKEDFLRQKQLDGFPTNQSVEETPAD